MEHTDVVATSHGPVRGCVKNRMRQFLGIPYAAPPVDHLRWRPPIPPPAWSEPLDAVAFGNVCAQDGSCFPGFGHTSVFEDGLYLNVFTPARLKHGQKLAVIVLIPGGGFFCGGSNDYNPAWLVCDGNVVLVSLNYRLTVFGFFSHPAINAEDHPAGNYGMMDQQLALRWIQSNIEAFGGDAGNITIMGESAGGISVMTHIASPGSAGLFHKAIAQSGGSPPAIPALSVKSAESRGVALASAAGCKEQTPETLRALSTSDILAANAMPPGTFGIGQYTVGVMEDGVVVPGSLRQKFATGCFNQVPLLMGVNKDEFSWFQAMMEIATGQVISPEAYPQALARTLQAVGHIRLASLDLPTEALNDVLRRYPVDSHPSPSRTLAAAVGDAGMISAAGRRTARIMKKFVHEVYVYEFDVPNSPTPWPEVSFPYGSAHTSELQYLFPLFHGASGKAQPLAESQRQLAKQMVLYWTSFARRGTPNPDAPEAVGSPHWPVYNGQEDNVMLLSAPKPEMIGGWGERHHSDFWDSFYV